MEIRLYASGGVVCQNADQVNINYLHFTVGADRISELMKFGSPKLTRKNAYTIYSCHFF